MSSNLRQKLNKRLKVAIGKSKRGNEKDNSYETENGGKTYSFSKSRSEIKKSSHDFDANARRKETGKYQPLNSDRRRKRVFVDQDVNANAISHRGLRLSKKGLETNPKSIRTMWVSNGAASNSKSTSNVVISAQESHGKLRKDSKQVDKTYAATKGSVKKQVKVKSYVTKHSDHNQDACRPVSPKKSSPPDSEGFDDLPKKRKRRIRLDPYDISNKRLDDAVAPNEISKEKQKDLEDDAEMSKNAQFRAIQPSPSILSFVEDNLLGRRRLIEIRRAGYNTELSAPLDNVPNSTSSERERIEENIFRNKLTFFAAAKVSSSFPPPDMPEIAFAGRSNVGKSSLLNALTRQWGVVRTSDKPGHTQTINFFDLGSKLCMVDLPGYGFAYAKEEIKEAWEDLVKEYVSTRVGLKRVWLLIDTKWGMKPRDHELIDLMERSQTKYQVVLTKTDVVFPIDVARRAMQIEESLKANKSVVQPVMMVSAKSGAGIQSMRTVLAKIARFAKL